MNEDYNNNQPHDSLQGLTILALTLEASPRGRVQSLPDRSTEELSVPSMLCAGVNSFKSRAGRYDVSGHGQRMFFRCVVEFRSVARCLVLLAVIAATMPAVAIAQNEASDSSPSTAATDVRLRHLALQLLGCVDNWYMTPELERNTQAHADGPLDASAQHHILVLEAEKKASEEKFSAIAESLRSDKNVLERVRRDGIKCSGLAIFCLGYGAGVTDASGEIGGSVVILVTAQAGTRPAATKISVGFQRPSYGKNGEYGFAEGSVQLEAATMSGSACQVVILPARGFRPRGFEAEFGDSLRCTLH